MQPTPRVLGSLIRSCRTAAFYAALLSFFFLGAAFGQTENPQKNSTKVVLYLGGGERSPWFHLGVLYAIEEFGVPVDSVVGTSWGAWVGALWAKGLSPDEIQRLMLDPAVSPFVGKDFSNELLDGDVAQNEIPLSEKGVPSLRKRFTFRSDSLGLHVEQKSVAPDTMRQKKSFARLRFQESLYRQPVGFVRPFALQGCNDKGALELRTPSVEEIVKSLPLWESAKGRNLSGATGEVCPFYALPAEDNPSELAIIVVADPLRNAIEGGAEKQVVRLSAAAHLANQPGLMVRAHAVADTSRASWIQAGFSAMEQRRTSFPELASRKTDYGASRQPSAKPWFRFTPLLDSLSPAIHDAVKAAWADADTGFAGPENLARRLRQNPAYDSLNFSMTPSGDLLIESAVHPTLDLVAGGFGSNAIGPNIYAAGALHFVDHIELELVLAGFWGGNSYGVSPRLDVSKLWGRRWGFSLGFDYLKREPLKSFYNEMDESLRFEYEERYDLNLSMYYEFDDRQTVAAEFLFGNRYYSVDSSLFKTDHLKTYPVSPSLRYSYRKGDEGWFATDGLELNASVGLESIGYSFGVIDLVPIYWKLALDSRYAISPKPFLTLSAGAVGGIEFYHEPGFGYVFPKSFDYRPLDLVYRLHAPASPWSAEWYNRELASHSYAMARTSASLHGKYLGAWLFASYLHDFEDGPLAELGQDKFVFEPALRLAYKSIVLYAGVQRIVNFDTFKNLTHLSAYNYFIRIGNYNF